VIAALYGVLFVFLSVLLAVGGLALVQHLVPWQVRRQHNDVAGFIYAVLGVVYAVLLGFVTIAVWEDFQAAKGTANSEANDLGELFWLAHEFPEPQRDKVQELTHSYARVVVDEEWSLMEQGHASPRAWTLVNEMRSSIYGFDPKTQAELARYDEGLVLVRDLVDQRRLRLLEASEGIPYILWGVLLIGGIIVVGFTYLFGLENTQSHTLMIALLAAVISIVLFTIHALDHPFSGITRVDRDAFEAVLRTMD
jgi:Protein of unknown function (DUF4239)